MNSIAQLTNALHGYGGGISKSQELAMNRKIANLTAYADIAGRITEASDYFYDIFEVDATNNSCGVIESASTQLTAALTAGASKARVTSTNGFTVGREMSLLDSSHKEDVIVQSIGIEQEITGYTESGTISSSYDIPADLTSTTIVGNTQSLTGNGGRRLAVLDNGWFVCCSLASPIITLYLSKDKGVTWNQCCYIDGGR